MNMLYFCHNTTVTFSVAAVNQLWILVICGLKSILTGYKYIQCVHNYCASWYSDHIFSSSSFYQFQTLNLNNNYK